MDLETLQRLLAFIITEDPSYAKDRLNEIENSWDIEMTFHIILHLTVYVGWSQMKNIFKKFLLLMLYPPTPEEALIVQEVAIFPYVPYSIFL